ncbi:hypothetical protein PCANC_04273 [Puccinia coronata f. sp. avenae]|uniref:Uncharacterized protein n=1 Tax=Puccinia coronata f. sp. avenae TaxID=200324 RepID=A0A2N5VUJ8_9BASI|nr:hypothetical protein PCANC_04273 [Puccinia coronata f. sp. avenae]
MSGPNPSQNGNKRPGEQHEEDRPPQRPRTDAEAPSPEPDGPRYPTRHRVALASSRASSAGQSQPAQNEPSQAQPPSSRPGAHAGDSDQQSSGAQAGSSRNIRPHRPPTPPLPRTRRETVRVPERIPKRRPLSWSPATVDHFERKMRQILDRLEAEASAAPAVEASAAPAVEASAAPAAEASAAPAVEASAAPAVEASAAPAVMRSAFPPALLDDFQRAVQRVQDRYQAELARATAILGRDSAFRIRTPPSTGAPPPPRTWREILLPPEPPQPLSWSPATLHTLQRTMQEVQHRLQCEGSQGFMRSAFQLANLDNVQRAIQKVRDRLPADARNQAGPSGHRFSPLSGPIDLSSSLGLRRRRSGSASTAGPYTSPHPYRSVPRPQGPPNSRDRILAAAKARAAKARASAAAAATASGSASQSARAGNAAVPTNTHRRIPADQARRSQVGTHSTAQAEHERRPETGTRSRTRAPVVDNTEIPTNTNRPIPADQTRRPPVGTHSTAQAEQERRPETGTRSSTRAPVVDHTAAPTNTSRPIPADQTRRSPVGTHSTAQAQQERRPETGNPSSSRGPSTRAAGSTRNRRVVLESRRNVKPDSIHFRQSLTSSYFSSVLLLRCSLPWRMKQLVQCETDISRTTNLLHFRTFYHLA